MRFTGSAVPVMKADGMVTCTPSSCGVVSQFRSKLRYQLMPPVNPVRVNSAM